MLIYQLQGTGTGTSIVNSTLHGSFSTEYSNLGYPTQGGIRNIAISNGSECGSPLNFDPYDELAVVDSTLDLPLFATNIVFTILNVFSVNPIRSATSLLSTDTDIKAQFNMKALPNQQSKQIYKGKLFIKKKVLFVINVEEQLIGQKYLYSSTSMLPLDNASGGVYDINQFITLPPEMSQFIIEQRFNFIPTYSSLDIGGGSQTIILTDVQRAYSPLTPPAVPKDVPFDNFFTNPTISENHIQFTLDNGNWLMDELKGNTAFYSCAGTCPSVDATVNGPSTVCTSNSAFQVANLNPNASVSWSKSSNLTYVSGQETNNYTVKAASNSTSGSGWIKVNINTGCGAPVVMQKNLWVGLPDQPVTDPSGYPTVQMNLGELKTIRVVSAPGNVSQYNWEVTGSVQQVSGSGSQIVIEAINTGWGNYKVKTQNDCGLSTYGGGSVNVSGGGGGLFMSFTPNPATDETIMALKTDEISGYDANQAWETVIYDDQMSVVKPPVGVKGRRFVISTMGWRTGVYFVKVTLRDRVLFGKFVVER